jgi:hypothetical protein
MTLDCFIASRSAPDWLFQDDDFSLGFASNFFFVCAPFASTLPALALFFALASAFAFVLAQIPSCRANAVGANLRLQMLHG